MKMISFYASCLFVSISLLYGTSSCTSKSGNASTTVNAVETVDEQNSLSDSDDPISMLMKGNERFCCGKCSHVHQDPKRIAELTKGQQPDVVVVSCSDSRVPPEIIFDQGLGDLFTIRTAGHVMSDFEEGSIEYAVEHLHSKLIIVLGHENCGAVHAMLEHVEDDNDDVEGHIASIVHTLKNQPEEQEVLKVKDETLYDRAVIANIIHGVKQLRTSEPVLSKKYEEGEIKIVGALYHLSSGEVEFLDI